MPRLGSAVRKSLAGVVLLLAPAVVRAQTAPYHWTISASNTDPFVNTTVPGPGLTFYLWLVCSNPPDPLQDGMSAAEFDVVTSGNLLHLATITQNGFLNAGGTTNLLLAVGGCPGGPVVAANLLVVHDDTGSMALSTSSANGNKVVVDCSAAPSAWAMSWTGLGVGEPPPGKGDGCTVDVPGACCFPDGSCLVVTFGECVTLGGTFQGDGTDCSVGCLVTTGACCFENGSCVQVDTAADCATLGGVFLGKGTDCSGGCPSFAGACCLPDGSCIVADGPQDCAAQGGTFQGTGTGCPAGCPVLTGACCFEDGSCTITLAGECASMDGLFQGKGTDCGGECPSFAGACCFPDGSCVVADGPADCAAQGGTFQGIGTACTGGCPVLTGACCFEDGSCLITLAGECASLGGLFQGEGSDCFGPCPSFAGACCLADGCVIADGPADCAAQGGDFLGVGTSCDDCPPIVGACCFSDGSCQQLSFSDCLALGGSFHGLGSSCALCNVQGDPAALWTISSSNIDPFANTGSIVGLTAYLWFACANFPGSIPDGIAAAEFNILTSGFVHLATITQNGFLNAGGTSNLLLAVGGCPSGPVVAANLLVQRTQEAATICLAPSPSGLKVVVDCRPVPDIWSIFWTGFSTVGNPCSKGADDCGIFTQLERMSWGKIKALYR